MAFFLLKMMLKYTYYVLGQHMIDLVEKGFDFLVQDKEMVKKPFQACGISSSDPGKVLNGAFFN